MITYVTVSQINAHKQALPQDQQMSHSIRHWLFADTVLIKVYDDLISILQMPTMYTSFFVLNFMQWKIHDSRSITLESTQSAVLFEFWFQFRESKKKFKEDLSVSQIRKIFILFLYVCIMHVYSHKYQVKQPIRSYRTHT